MYSTKRYASSLLEMLERSGQGHVLDAFGTCAMDFVRHTLGMVRPRLVYDPADVIGIFLDHAVRMQ